MLIYGPKHFYILMQRGCNFKAYVNLPQIKNGDIDSAVAVWHFVWEISYISNVIYLASDFTHVDFTWRVQFACSVSIAVIYHA